MFRASLTSNPQVPEAMVLDPRCNCDGTLLVRVRRRTVRLRERLRPWGVFDARDLDLRRRPTRRTAPGFGGLRRHLVGALRVRRTYRTQRLVSDRRGGVPGPGAGRSGVHGPRDGHEL